MGHWKKCPGCSNQMERCSYEEERDGALGPPCFNCEPAFFAGREDALLDRDIAEVEKEIRDIRTEIAAREQEADICEENVPNLRAQWHDDEAHRVEDRGRFCRAEVRRLKKRLARPEAWVARAKAALVPTRA